MPILGKSSHFLAVMAEKYSNIKIKNIGQIQTKNQNLYLIELLVSQLMVKSIRSNKEGIQKEE